MNRNYQVTNRWGVPQWQTLDEARPPVDVDTEVAPVISAIVVFWEESPPFGPCLQNLRKAGHRLGDALEIIVVDNGSQRDLADTLTGLWDHWIEISANLGPGHARNIGARVAQAPVIAFVDEDARLDEDYFRNALTYFDDPDVLGIRGRIEPLQHPLFSALATHYHRGPEPVDDALITEGASIVRRSVFVDAGGFPHNVDGHEGIEMTHRLKQLRPDGKTLYVPDVVLHHDYVEGWREFIAKATRHAHNEVDIENRDPEAAKFLDEYFSRTFPGPDLTYLQQIARQLLRAIRFLIQSGARFRTRLQRREKSP